jgi:hypothetical protein
MMPRHCAILLSLIAATCARAEPSPKPGEVIFASGFDTPAEQQAWPLAEFAEWATGHAGTPSLCVTVPAAKVAAGNMLSMPLDLTKFRGCVVVFECLAKAENVSKPTASYLGVKFMLHYQSATLGPIWQNENDVFGTFDWRKLSFSARIAPDATAGTLSLGLGCSKEEDGFLRNLRKSFSVMLALFLMKCHPEGFLRPGVEIRDAHLFKGFFHLLLG